MNSSATKNTNPPITLTPEMVHTKKPSIPPQDCMFPTVKEADKVVKKALYLVAGIDTDGYKEILGFWLVRQESASFWVNVFNDLKARGVEDILVVVSDELKGIQEAVRSVYAMSDHQKCLVHKVRNSLKKVKYKDRKGVDSALRSIYMSSTQMQAKENFERFKREYQAEYPQVVKDWERELEDILTFYKYPYEIRRMLATTFETVPKVGGVILWSACDGFMR